MKLIQDTYMWIIISKWLGCQNDFEIFGQLLKRKKINLQDFAVVFYSKLARYGSESLRDKIYDALKLWIEENHDEAQVLYDSYSPEVKQEIDKMVKELKSL